MLTISITGRDAEPDEARATIRTTRKLDLKNEGL